MHPIGRALLSSAICLSIMSGCASHRPPDGRNGGPGDNRIRPGAALSRERTRDAQMLMRYDANQDGVLTRAEMEAGLKRDFDACDVNRDGHLDADEIRAENDRRFKIDGPQASPVIDWNHDGIVDFAEFSATARSLFDELDQNHDGTLAKDEIRPQRDGDGDRGAGKGRDRKGGGEGGGQQ